MTNLIAMLNEVNSILDGEVDFEDMRKSDKLRIFDLVTGSTTHYTDWDDRLLTVCGIGDKTNIVFISGSAYSDENRKTLYGGYLEVDGDQPIFDADGIQSMIEFLTETTDTTEKTILNYTPHSLVIYSEDQSEIIETIPTVIGDDGKPVFIRVVQMYADAGEVNGVPLVATKLGEAVGLPQPQPDTYLVVSMMVAQALPERTDLLVPDTNLGAVRNDSGQIIGTTRFLRV